MNTWKSCSTLIAVAALTLGLAACGDDEQEEAPTAAAETAVPESTVPDGVQGSGNVVTQEFEFADFAAVEVANAFVVDIVQADSYSVTVRVDDDAVDRLDVSKDGDTLRIRLERGASLRGDVTLEASVTMPDLDRLVLSGASKGSVSGFHSSGQLEIGLSGASSVDGDLEARTIDIDASGASKVALEGSAAGMTIVGSGASNLDLAGFTVDTADVSLSGASEATLNVQERIDPVNVSGASRLRYLGNPDLGEVTSSGASTVERVGD